MKKILLFLLLFAGVQVAIAQDCEPDPQYADAPAGVYPLPDTVGSPTSSLPTGYQNQPYELVFTAVVPDTTTVELTPGNPSLLDLDNVTLIDIDGLPPGLSHACDPPDCVFPDQAQGCVIISGTPTQVGTYSLVVNTTVGVGVAMLPVTFPGLLVAGEYKIIIEEEVSTFEFKVYNIIGKLMHEEELTLSTGNNTVTFNGSKLHSGMYFYSIGQGNDRVTRRMVVHRP